MRRRGTASWIGVGTVQAGTDDAIVSADRALDRFMPKPEVRLIDRTGRPIECDRIILRIRRNPWHAGDGETVLALRPASEAGVFQFTGVLPPSIAPRSHAYLHVPSRSGRMDLGDLEGLITKRRITVRL